MSEKLYQLVYPLGPNVDAGAPVNLAALGAFLVYPGKPFPAKGMTADFALEIQSVYPQIRCVDEKGQRELDALKKRLEKPPEPAPPPPPAPAPKSKSKSKKGGSK